MRRARRARSSPGRPAGTASAPTLIAARVRRAIDSRVDDARMPRRSPDPITSERARLRAGREAARRLTYVTGRASSPRRPGSCSRRVVRDADPPEDQRFELQARVSARTGPGAHVRAALERHRQSDTPTMRRPPPEDQRVELQARVSARMGPGAHVRVAMTAGAWVSGDEPELVGVSIDRPGRWMGWSRRRRSASGWMVIGPFGASVVAITGLFADAPPRKG